MSDLKYQWRLEYIEWRILSMSMIKRIQNFFIIVKIANSWKIKKLSKNLLEEIVFFVAFRDQRRVVAANVAKGSRESREESGKGGLRFTVQHNIKAVCVGARSGGVLHASPPRQPPPPPQDARAGSLIGRHYSKWRLRHIRSVLLAYRERRRRRFSWWLAKNFAAALRPRAGSSRDFRRDADSAARRRDRSVNDCETPDVTLRIAARV